MRITTKGQVTIPQSIREKFGISPAVEVDFVEEKGRIYLVKIQGDKIKPGKLRRLRGTATVKMSTDEIMALTRG
jgi:AbrB family looped-hinge helix DNA binding protein